MSPAASRVARHATRIIPPTTTSAVRVWRLINGVDRTAPLNRRKKTVSTIRNFIVTSRANTSAPRTQLRPPGGGGLELARQRDEAAQAEHPEDRPRHRLQLTTAATASRLTPDASTMRSISTGMPDREQGGCITAASARHGAAGLQCGSSSSGVARRASTPTAPRAAARYSAAMVSADQQPHAHDRVERRPPRHRRPPGRQPLGQRVDGDPLQRHQHDHHGRLPDRPGGRGRIRSAPSSSQA